VRNLDARWTGPSDAEHAASRRGAEAFRSLCAQAGITVRELADDVEAYGLPTAIRLAGRRTAQERPDDGRGPPASHRRGSIGTRPGTARLLIRSLSSRPGNTEDLTTTRRLDLGELLSKLAGQRQQPGCRRLVDVLGG
jgi:hypothetical protein